MELRLIFHLTLAEEKQGHSWTSKVLVMAVEEVGSPLLYRLHLLHLPLGTSEQESSAVLPLLCHLASQLTGDLDYLESSPLWCKLSQLPRVWEMLMARMLLKRWEMVPLLSRGGLLTSSSVRVSFAFPSTSLGAATISLVTVVD